MSWISKWADKMSGKSMKEDLGALGGRWDDAYGTKLDTSSALGAQHQLMQRGQDMLDPYSQDSLMKKSMISEGSADDRAEAMRLQQRGAAAAGGAPVGVMAQQAGAMANKGIQQDLNSFNQLMGQQQGAATGLISGAASNIANMQGNKFNLLENQNYANKQIDADAAKWSTNMFSQGAQAMIPGGAQAKFMAKFLPGLAGGGAQQGGFISGMAEGGWIPESYDSNDSSQKLNIDGQNAYLKMTQEMNSPAMDDYDAPDFPSDMEEEEAPEPNSMMKIVMGPKGPIQIGTRMGGELIG